MLLPTNYYMIGALLAVALSFLILTNQTISRWLDEAYNRRPLLHTSSRKSFGALSILSNALIFIGIYIGLYGSPDPLSNPLSLGVWTGWWIGFSLVQVLHGDLWVVMNPWRWWGLFLDSISQGKFGRKGFVRLPSSIGYLPAIILFFCFAWFELISIAPEDPPRLAVTVFLYWLVNFLAVTIFGLDDWLERGEAFSVFFRLIGGFSPIARTRTQDVVQLSLQMPGATFVNAAPLPLSGIALVLLMLGTASFDGLSETFTWHGVWGGNPLEYAGRSSTQFENTIGLVLTPVALGAAYFIALWFGLRLTGHQNLTAFAGQIIYSIVPISIAFHLSHYLTALLINGQFLVKALADPLVLGWDLFGTADLHVTASFIQNINSVWIIWTAQVAIITIGHMAGIILAHIIAMRHFGSHLMAARSQIFLAALMVFYTVFGLWLLSTPTIG